MNYKSWPRQHVLPTFKPALNKLTNLHLSQNPDIIKTEFLHSEATFVLHINNCKSDWIQTGFISLYNKLQDYNSN